MESNPPQNLGKFSLEGQEECCSMKSWQCQECGKVFQKASHLKGHNSCHRSERPHRCLECGACFKYLRNLKEHKTIHSAVPAFICAYCGTVFKQKSNLLKHEHSHKRNTNSLHRCSICSKMFTQSSHMKQHILAVHNALQSECKDCGASLSSKSSLHRHMATVHASSPKFTCHHCGRGFTNNQNYQGHLRRHTGESPFCCSVCAKSFATSKSLKRHKLIHQAAKPHKCPHCPKAFLESGDLNKHLKRHSSPKKTRGMKQSPQKPSTLTDAKDTLDPSLSIMVLTEEVLFENPELQENDVDSSKLTNSDCTVVTKNDGLKGQTEIATASLSFPPKNAQVLDQLPDLSSTHIIEASSQIMEASPLLPSSSMMAPPQHVTSVSVLTDAAIFQSEDVSTINQPINEGDILQHSTDVTISVTSSDHSQVSLSAQQIETISNESQHPNCHHNVLVLAAVNTPSDFLVSDRQGAKESKLTEDTESVVTEVCDQQKSETILGHAKW